MTHPANEIKNLRRRANKTRKFPENTCPASRHLHIMADRLLNNRSQAVVTAEDGKTYSVRYWMLLEEPEHCAESILAVIASLWEARTKLAKLEARLSAERKKP